MLLFCRPKKGRHAALTKLNAALTKLNARGITRFSCAGPKKAGTLLLGFYFAAWY